MTARYRVYARDVAYRNLGEIPDYADLKVQLRFNDNGGWHLTAASNSRAASLLGPTGGIIITRDNLDGNGPSVVFSGPVTDYNIDAERIEVAGASDELLLLERAASPDPTADGGAGDAYATEQDLREGTASTVMLEYVSYNAGPLAITRRSVPQLTIGTDLGLGSYIYGQARWISLLALMQELALAGGGLRFRVLQSDVTAGEIEFTVSQPVDRTATVVISKGRKTLGEWKRTVIRPAASYVYVLGQGQGINRQVVEGGDGAMAATYGRYSELVADRRDTNDVLVLEQTRANLLEENGEARVVAYTPLDAPSATWGVDYDLGDLVTVLTPDGEQLDEVVRGVDLSLSASGVVEVQPIVSTPGDTADDPSSRQERAVTRRVSNLERNIDSLAATVSVQWNVGDYRMTARAAAAAGWLLCDGTAVSRTTYATLFGVLGTTYGAGDGATTFTLPDYRDRVPIGKSGTKALGSTGGAATVDASHTHNAGTLLGPSHGHAAGTLLGPSHTHSGPSHTHAAGTLAGPSHTHTGPSHTHGAGTLAGPSHDHSGSSLSITGNTGGPSATSTRADGANPVASDAHTHGVGSLDVAGNTATGGNGAVTGATAADGTGATGAGGTGAVTGATAADGTGNTGASGTGSVTGITAADGTQAVTGATATGGSAALSILPPYLAANWEVYAGV